MPPVRILRTLTPSSSRSLARLSLLAGIAFAILWFAALDHRKLIRPDEGRYGEISREMAASGDWLTPRLNGYKYFEKPPLQYWATAAAYKLFGVGEWTTRLWTALTGFACILLVFYFANRILAPPAGLLAGAALAGSGLFVFIGQLATLDMALSFFLSLAVFAGVLGQTDSVAPVSRRRWMWLAWIAMALATLSKGLVGIVLPAAALVLYILWKRDWARLRNIELPVGALLFLAVAAPWFVAVSAQNPEFADFFFIHEHLERFTSKVHGRYEPLWYFLPVLAVGITPWLPSLAASLWQAARHKDAAPRKEAQPFEPLAFLLVWCATVFVFFSVSDSKLPSYILPIFPALALLIGWQLSRASEAFYKWQSVLAALTGIGFALSGLFIDQLVASNSPRSVVDDYRPWLVGAGAALAIGAALSLLALARGRKALCVVLLGAGGLVAVKAILLGHDVLSDQHSSYRVVERARPVFQSAEREAPFLATPFYAVDVFDHTIPFYLGPTVTMVAYRDELAKPISWEPPKFVPTVAEFRVLWARAPQAYAILRPEALATLQREQQLAAEVISATRRLVIIRKR